MRRRRSPRYLPTILTFAVGVVAVPARVGAEDDPSVPLDESALVPAPSDEANPPETAPTTGPMPTPSSTTVPTPLPTSVPVSTTAPAPAPATTSSEPPPPTTQVSATDAETVATEPTAAAPTPEGTAAPAAVAEHPAPESAPVDDDELDADASAVLPDGEVRTIAFPVLGPVQYANDWGSCRAGCTRRHQGNDMIGTRMQPLLAAVDGTVTRVRYDNVGTAGAVITITGADGWYYNYFHLNNDTPGTDDGAAGREWQISPQLAVGSPVRAGQVIAYMGDSGNAEGSVPHLHFEIRRPDRTPVNPYRSLVAAQRRAACGDGLPLLASDAASLSAAVVAIIPLDGGGRWLIDADGRVFADGSAGHIVHADGVLCETVDPPVTTLAPALAAPSTPSDVIVAPAAAPSDPAPAVVAAPQPEVPPTDRPWTVERGQSLWTITQSAYGVSDVATTVALVNAVFEHNRDLLIDPSLLTIGVTLQLPPAV